MSVLFFNSAIHKFLLLGSFTKIHTMSWQRNSHVISYTIKEGLTLIKPGSGRTVQYWNLISFDLAFTRFKFTCSGICQVGKRGYFPKTVRFHQSSEKELESRPDAEAVIPPTLCTVQDRKLMKP
jgi:hypothetical protein